MSAFWDAEVIASLLKDYIKSNPTDVVSSREHQKVLLDLFHLPCRSSLLILAGSHSIPITRRSV